MIISKIISKETATLAAGCFWGVEEHFRKIPGVLETQVGYTGGNGKESTYEEVCTGRTGHAESVKIKFDPKKIPYRDLLIIFFKIHDPTTENQQGNDRGSQYRSAIFTHSDEQHRIAIELKQQIEQTGVWGKPLKTEVTKAKTFYLAEDYHQKYLKKNLNGYDNHYTRNIKID